MSEHILAAIVTLEHELEALDQKRGDLESAIRALRKLADEGVTPNGRGRRPVKRGRPRKQTNERTKRAPHRTAPRSLPDGAGAAIVTALRTKSPQSPAELAKALKLSRATLTYQIKPLIKSGAVVATGATMNRQFSLPPRSKAAKEAP